MNLLPYFFYVSGFFSQAELFMDNTDVVNCHLTFRTPILPMPNVRVKILQKKSPVCKFEQDAEMNYQCCSGTGGICSTRYITILPKCFALQDMMARKKTHQSCIRGNPCTQEKWRDWFRGGERGQILPSYPPWHKDFSHVMEGIALGRLGTRCPSLGARYYNF